MFGGTQSQPEDVIGTPEDAGYYERLYKTPEQIAEESEGVFKRGMQRSYEDMNLGTRMLTSGAKSFVGTSAAAAEAFGDFTVLRGLKEAGIWDDSKQRSEYRRSLHDFLEKYVSAGQYSKQGMVRRTLENAPESIVTAVSSGPAAIPVFMAKARAQAMTEAEEVGLSEEKAKSYANRAALIEGTITTAFSLAGMGGTEKMAANMFKSGFANALKDASLKGVLKSMGPEVLEELGVFAVDSWNRKYSHVDEEALLRENLLNGGAETALGAIFQTGAMGSMSVYQSRKSRKAIREIYDHGVKNQDFIDTWVRFNPDQAKALSEKESVSRRDLEKAGILAKTNDAQRKEIVSKIRTSIETMSDPLALQEAQDAQEAIPTQEVQQEVPVQKQEIVGEEADVLAPEQAIQQEAQAPVLSEPEPVDVAQDVPQPVSTTATEQAPEQAPTETAAPKPSEEAIKAAESTLTGDVAQDIATAREALTEAKKDSQAISPDNKVDPLSDT
jgi:hypothetical protein